MPGLGRSNLVVATGTAISRITGLARIIVFGMIIGQTALADAFDAANNAPNSIYELLIGGLLVSLGSAVSGDRVSVRVSVRGPRSMAPGVARERFKGTNNK